MLVTWVAPGLQSGWGHAAPWRVQVVARRCSLAAAHSVATKEHHLLYVASLWLQLKRQPSQQAPHRFVQGFQVTERHGVTDGMQSQPSKTGSQLDAGVLSTVSAVIVPQHFTRNVQLQGCCESSVGPAPGNITSLLYLAHLRAATHLSWSCWKALAPPVTDFGWVGWWLHCHPPALQH